MMFWARRLDQCLIAEINFSVLSLDAYGLYSWIGTMSYAHARVSENNTNCALFSFSWLDTSDLKVQILSFF